MANARHMAVRLHVLPDHRAFRRAPVECHHAGNNLATTIASGRDNQETETRYTLVLTNIGQYDTASKK